jgi:serine/threonine protein kinase
LTFEDAISEQAAAGEQPAVGVADYVAPEQVTDSRHVDSRADIYSLGCTFYFLLTGRRPFPKATLLDVLMAHRNEKLEPIDRFRSDVPEPLMTIIERMTAKDPCHRYPTASEAADQLHSWLNASISDRDHPF